jgi:hypothetical protein
MTKNFSLASIDVLIIIIIIIIIIMIIMKYKICLLINVGIPHFPNEKVGQSYRSLKSYHWGEGGEVAESCLLIFMATRGRNTPKLTAKMGKYMQNSLRVQKMSNTVIMKSLRLKMHKKTLKNVRVTRKCGAVDRLMFTFKGNQNLLKQRRVSRALPPSVLAV